MKKTLIILLSIIWLSANSQTKEPLIAGDSAQYTYCQIVGTGRLLSNKVTVELDFGQFRSIWNDNRLKDPATGERIVFNGMIDALNYMGNLGWEFVQAYAITLGNQNVYHYLLKKSKKIIEQEEKSIK